MKIMQIVSGMIYGGAEKQAEAIMVAAREKGHKLSAVTNVGAKFAEVLQNRKFEEVYQIPLHKEMSPEVLRGFKEVIEMAEPDVVNVHTPKPITALILAKMTGSEFGLVVSRRVTFPINPVSLRLKWRNAHIDRIISNTAMAAEYLKEKKVSADKVKVVYSGSYVDQFHPGIDGSSCRARLGVPADAKLVIKVANFYQWKGYDTFLETARILTEKRPDIYFAAFGARTDYFDRLKPKAEALPTADRILFPGYVDDMPEVYGAADILLHCTLEGDALSGSMREAMACGVPVVGSRGGANPELVEHGVCGLLFPPGDAEAAATEIEKLLDDPVLAQELAEEGRRRVIQNFSMERMLAATMDVYREAAEIAKHGL